MILSAESLLSDDQAITATALSTNVIDLGAPGTPYGAAAALNQDQGKGTVVPILIQVTEAFNNLTSLTITLEVDDNSSISSGKVVNTQTILQADLLIGKTVFMQHLTNGVDERYLAVRYTVTGTPPTTGKITAGITMGNQTNL